MRAIMRKAFGMLVPTRAPRGGTSSLRRLVSLRARRPDLTILPVRGNVDTRLRKVDAGEYEAIVLARAGLARLGLEARITETLSPEVSLPAVGQGALGIECREDDAATRAFLSNLHHLPTAICVAAERGVLFALEGDCKTPIAAFAELDDASIRLRAFVCDPDGSNLRSLERRASIAVGAGAEEAARALGLEAGHALLESRGA